MRKLIFLIFLLSAIAALGHDIYFFTQEQDKGFRLSDTGALWAKYHKESHDNWKINISDLGKTIDEIIPEKTPEQETSETETSEQPDYTQNFSQLDSKDQAESVELPTPEPSMEEHTDKAHKVIGTLLRQKAVFLFGGIALFLYLLNALVSKVCRPKEGMDAVKKYKKGQKSGYQYKRK